MLLLKPYCGVEPEAEAVPHLQYCVKKDLNLKSLSPDSCKWMVKF